MNLLRKLFGKKEENPFEEAGTFEVELFEDEEALILIKAMKESNVSFIRLKDCQIAEETERKLREKGYTAKNIQYQGRPGILLMR